MLCGLLRLMSRLIPLALLLRLLLLILLVPLLILLLMRGLLLSLMPRLILLLLRLMRGLLLSLIPWVMLRLPLIRRATFTVALAASAAIVASTSPAPSAASGFEASGQSMASVGPVRAPVELLHANETTLAQFVPPGKFHVPSESVVGDVTVPGSYLHSALFVVQSGSNEDGVWIADSGASCHMTHDRTRIYNVRPPPPGRETITIGDRRRIKVEYIGNMDVIFHGKLIRGYR